MKLHEKLLLKGDHVCPWWLAYTFDNPLRRIFHKPEKTLGPYLQTGMTAVDLGCGMGYFSIAMAEIVGENGLVIAVDIQQKMLDVVARRASSRGVRDRIQLHRCESDAIGLTRRVDFALTFWMVHEVPNKGRFMGQVRSLLKPGGKYLLVEPKFHIGAAKFENILQDAASGGFETLSSPAIALSRAVLYQNPIQ
ncbi:MAG: class I SAM-dependent methyltransferase [Proteobacteria bacterium]|nr:class I SAM-dependent methyltransferase [Pseudomonadota bacterium]